ncbi:response regulator [Peredibacter starrii]|uniref:Response regulator n=1 Tax=Peredibacter starrii TaxID=28202 RepID=A0AAX4HUL3_9BACT|nr:response regulator [Peredibacter starrii]WPU66977.1 response regulator [Peredibacter starrii]
MMKRKILIVEDDPSIRNSLREILEGQGYLVEVSKNGLEAFRVMTEKSFVPDLIVLDLMMPEMNGFEFRELQMEDTRYSHIPVILLTANNRFQEYKEPLKAFEFLNKPLEVDDLIFVVQNCFRLMK